MQAQGAQYTCRRGVIQADSSSHNTYVFTQHWKIVSHIFKGFEDFVLLLILKIDKRALCDTLYT